MNEHKIKFKSNIGGMVRWVAVCTCVIFSLLVVFLFLPVKQTQEIKPTQYLAFQIFSANHNDKSMQRNIPQSIDMVKEVNRLIKRIGTTGDKKRTLAFIPGPLSFNHSDHQIQKIIDDSFLLSIERNIAVGFHLDDSMFWNNSALLKDKDVQEWINWQKIPNANRKLNWSSTPTRIAPQLCLNHPDVIKAVKRRAHFIANIVNIWVDELRVQNKEYLFAGIIAGWETQLGSDFESGDVLGYCALANKGYDQSTNEMELDRIRAEIVKDFINLWTKNLHDAGIDKNKLYSHIAFRPIAAFQLKKQTEPGHPYWTYERFSNYTPPSAAFSDSHIAGFSTYPEAGMFDALYEELQRQGNPPWASCEGTAIEPYSAEMGKEGIRMEDYLGNLYGHGAVLVNIFGWGVGNSNNPFRQVAESNDALSTYRQFLRGDVLQFSEHIGPELPSIHFFPKVKKLQQHLPPKMRSNPKKFQPLVQEFEGLVDAGRYKDAEQVIDRILK